MESGSSERARANLAILPRSSVTMRSAVLVPIKGKSFRKAVSPCSIARAISFMGRTRHLSALIKLAVERIEKTNQPRRQVASPDAAIDVVDRIQGPGITPLRLRHQAQTRGDSGRHQNFVAERSHFEE